MFRKVIYMAIASLFFVSCASDFEAEKAITRAEMTGDQGMQRQQELKNKIANELRPVYFEVGSSKITDRFKRRLDKNIEVLDQNPEFKIYLTGHADKTGNESLNWELAMKRAKSVEDYLVQKGISRDRIYTISKGENDPKVSASDESYYQVNRRVEFEPFTTSAGFAE